MRHILTLTALLALTALQAQDIVKQHLALPSHNGAMVVIGQDRNAAEALDSYRDQPKDSLFMGYRVGIFFDNSATARASAIEARKLFAEHFPEVPVFMSYDNPYFKVTAGNCIEQQEADMLLHRVKRYFPKAYRLRETITAKEIINYQPLDSLAAALDSIQSDSVALRRNRELIDSLTLQLELLQQRRLGADSVNLPVALSDK